MQDDLNRIKNCYDVDKAVGQDLDLIGSIIDMRRPTAVGQEIQTSHYYNDGQYGDADQYNAAGGTAFAPMDDERYRILLKAKIAKNTSKGSMDDIATAIQFITSVPCRVIDHHDMTFSLEFSAKLTDIQRDMIDNYDIVPEPICVKYIGKTETPTLTLYGEAQYGRATQYNAQIN